AVWVAGFQTERGHAAELVHNLQYLRAGVNLADVTGGHFAEVLLSDPEEATLVLIDGRRYSRLTRDLAVAARAGGIPVTLITDPYCDWAPGLVTELFAVPTDPNHFWDTTSAMSSPIGLLVNGVCRERGAEAAEHMARAAALYDDFIGHTVPGPNPGKPGPSQQRGPAMTRLFRKTLLSASVSLAALIAAQAATAQEAVFVMATNEVGAPTYNPIKATML